MDDRGRLAQSLKGMVRSDIAESARARPRAARSAIGLARILDRWSYYLDRHLPRGLGVLAAAGVMLAGLGYGVVRGEHLPAIVAALKDARDAAGNAAGFRLVSVALGGNQQVTREDLLAGAGITPTTSLLFLDVDDVRERLKANPWIADVSVLKLYPGELRIDIKEREAFALWQKDGKLSVISSDGTVLEPFAAPLSGNLPFVVGSGAQAAARQFLSALDAHPALRERVRASVLVGERRWNLRLYSGVDVLLPEGDVTAALDRLEALEREKSLTTRDIVAIDLRLPDRVTVRLSDAAAQARMEALKEKAKKKGGNA
jgi:cell division protein FtsQ